MIDSSEISVVIQGPILGVEEPNPEKQITRRCCTRVRELLPDAEIIISTWENSIVNDLDYDIVLFNNDPGFFMMTLNGVKRPNNTNRMIVSSKNGLNRASKKYVIKMRSDLYLDNINFLSKFGIYDKMFEDSILEAKIITLSANSYKRGADIIFTLNDWFAFGLTKDIRTIWEISIQNEDELIKTGELARFEDNLVGEDYVWVSFLKKDPKYSNELDKYNSIIPRSSENICLYEQSLAEYAVIYDADQLGINSLKYPNMNYTRRDFARASCFTHTEWIKLYKKYFDSSIHVPFAFKDYRDIICYNIVFRFLQKRLRPAYNFIKKLYKKG